VLFLCAFFHVFTLCMLSICVLFLCCFPSCVFVCLSFYVVCPETQTGSTKVIIVCARRDSGSCELRGGAAPRTTHRQTQGKQHRKNANGKHAECDHVQKRNRKKKQRRKILQAYENNIYTLYFLSLEGRQHIPIRNTRNTYIFNHMH
jgi:hypothetical protein